MTLKELKDAIYKIDNKFNNFLVTNGQIGEVEMSDGKIMVVKIGDPVVAIRVEEDSSEICLYHQTREIITEFHKDMPNDRDEDDDF